MASRRPLRNGFVWVELLVILAALLLILQLSPSLVQYAISAIDVRNWSRTTWFVVNLLVALLLVGIRYGPEVLASFQGNRPQTRGGTHKKGR